MLACTRVKTRGAPHVFALRLLCIACQAGRQRALAQEQSAQERALIEQDSIISGQMQGVSEHRHLWPSTSQPPNPSVQHHLRFTFRRRRRRFCTRLGRLVGAFVGPRPSSSSSCPAPCRPTTFLPAAHTHSGRKGGGEKGAEGGRGGKG